MSSEARELSVVDAYLAANEGERRSALVPELADALRAVLDRLDQRDGESSLTDDLIDALRSDVENALRGDSNV